MNNFHTVTELLAIVAQQRLEIEALENMLELERALRRKSNARLLAAGGVLMAKVDQLDQAIARRAA